MFASDKIDVQTEVCTPLRVLIADDDRSVLSVMNHVVRFLGHAVAGTAITGQECVRRARELRPDLVIVDFTMPGLDGVETAKAILKNSHVPIIIVSGTSDEDLSERLKNTEIAGHLGKPFNLAQVKAAIAAALESESAVALC